MYFSLQLFALDDIHFTKHMQIRDNKINLCIIIKSLSFCSQVSMFEDQKQEVKPLQIPKEGLLKKQSQELEELERKHQEDIQELAIKPQQLPKQQLFVKPLQQEQEYKLLIKSFQGLELQGLPQQPLPYIQPQVKCLYCLEEVDSVFFQQHQESCKQNYSVLMLQDQTYFVNCPDCNLEFTNEQIKLHGKECTEFKMNCQYCSLPIVNYLLTDHKEACPKKPSIPPPIKNLFSTIPWKKEAYLYEKEKEKEEERSYFLGTCIWCQVAIDLTAQEQHKHSCPAKLQTLEKLGSAQLSPAQFQLIHQMYVQSAEEHLKVKRTILPRMLELGYDAGDLLLMQEYILHQAPLIIHFSMGRDIHYFNRDTRYRNLFEVNRSGGSKSVDNRKYWEENLFGRHSRNLTPQERVKYGVMNYSNDKFGMMKCRAYGESIIVLKPSVRARCTIAHKRTYGAGETVATLKYIYPVLSRYSEDELRALCLASRGFEVESKELSSFKEVHIHGPLRFGEDIECIYTTREQLKIYKYQIDKFENRFGVRVLAIEDLEQSITL